MTLIVKLYQRFLSNGDYSNNFWRKKEVICSWLSRCSTARGPDPWYNWGGPAKVGACKGPFINADLAILATPVRVLGLQVVSLGHFGGFVAF